MGVKYKPLIDPKAAFESRDQTLFVDVTVQNNKAKLSTSDDTKRIANSIWIDLKKDFSDTKAEFPMTMLSPELFMDKCNSLGISRNTRIVFFDRVGTYYSPRAWWMFASMGFNSISILDGGLPSWTELDLPLIETKSTEERSVSSTNLRGHVADEMAFVNLPFITTAIYDPKICIIDARSSNRFNALVPEPRPGIRSGQIQGSINMPFSLFLANGRYKSDAEISTIFNDIPPNTERIVFTCGSGVTACIPAIKARMLTGLDVSVYDGSWTEFATKTT